jgi:hypothetical protein
LGITRLVNVYLYLKDAGISFGNIINIYQQIIQMGKQDDLRTIGTFLEEAGEYGLEAEVVYTALKHIQEDPSTSVIVAMQIAMDEWIK